MGNIECQGENLAISLSQKEMAALGDDWCTQGAEEHLFESQEDAQLLLYRTDPPARAQDWGGLTSDKSHKRSFVNQSHYQITLIYLAKNDGVKTTIIHSPKYSV